MSLNTLPIEPYLIKPSPDTWMTPGLATANTARNMVPNPGMFYPGPIPRPIPDVNHEKPSIVPTKNNETKQALHPVQTSQGPPQPQSENQEQGKLIATPAAEIPKPFSCEICRKCFAKASQYKQHKITHSDYRPCPCTVEGCGKAFRRKSHLAEHMLIHTGDKVILLY